jgi:hypothetical protein
MEPQTSPAEQLPLLPSFEPTHGSYSVPDSPFPALQASPRKAFASGAPASRSALGASGRSSTPALSEHADTRTAALSHTLDHVTPGVVLILFAFERSGFPARLNKQRRERTTVNARTAENGADEVSA